VAMVFLQREKLPIADGAHPQPSAGLCTHCAMND
jgi:hypothetical protein